MKKTTLGILRKPLYGLTALLLTAAFTFAAEGPADLIVVNGNVLTVDAKFTTAEAVAVRDGVFIAVGSNTDVKKLAGGQSRVIDAHGMTVTPGLIDSHVHAIGVARGEVGMPFRELNSIGAMQQWVRERAGRSPRDRGSSCLAWM